MNIVPIVNGNKADTSKFTDDQKKAQKEPKLTDKTKKKSNKK